MRTQRERFSQLAARVQRTAKPSSRRVEQLAVAASFDRSLKHQRVGSNNRHRSLFASRQATVLTLRQFRRSPDRNGASRRLLTTPIRVHTIGEGIECNDGPQGDHR
jgi:hypothetical protein